jgi:protease I
MANIAVVLGEDFEDSEFRKPYDALRQAGHHIDIIGVRAGSTMKGKKGQEEVRIEKSASDADPARYDALVVPGGYSPDHLRTDKAVVDFTQSMLRDGKVVAAVCHGPQLLIEAEGVKGRVVTSWPSVRKDLENAGATWVDEEVHVDGKLITSRKPQDLPAFIAAIAKQLA